MKTSPKAGLVVPDLGALGRDPFAQVDLQATMEFALEMAGHSPDPSTQNGAVVIAQDGVTYMGHCNEFPQGVAMSDERWERPLKYSYVEHAERNVIFAAAKAGLALDGAMMVAPWAACADCARAIVQAGIRRLVRLPAQMENTAAHWNESVTVGDTILLEGGVDITELDTTGVTLKCPPLRRDGKPWSPNLDPVDVEYLRRFGPVEPAS